MAAKATAKPAPKAGGPPRAYLLWGQEELRKRAALQSLIESLVPPEDRELDVQYIDATNPGVTGEMLLHAARDRAMFSERRVVVVLNAGRLRGPKHLRTQDVLAEGIASLPEWGTLILVAYAEDADERRGKVPFLEPLMLALKAHGKVMPFPLLKPEELADLAMKEAALLGKRLPAATAAQLVQRVGSDSQQVLQEVRKLAAYVGEAQAISSADVAAMVAMPQDDNLFHMLDATMSGDMARAIGILRQLEAGGTAMPALVGNLRTALRNLAQAKMMQDHRIKPEAGADQIPEAMLALLPEDTHIYTRSSDWQRRKWWEQAQRMSWAQLHRAFDRLALMDAGAKGWDQGVEDPALAMELYIAHLCATVRPGSAAAPPRGGYRR